jgi:choline monooxygenase
VRSAVWFDTVFVNLSGGAASFGDFIRPVTERWRDFDLSLLRLADASEFKVASNWKFIQENFLDAAHVPWVHSQLRGPKHVLGSEATLLSDDLFGYLLPGTGVGERAKQGPTLSGFPNLPAKFASALDLLLVFPNTGLLLTPRWAQVLSVHPVSPAETSELLSTYVVGEGMMREENAKSRHWLVSFLHEVNGQDLRIVRLQQDGVKETQATAVGSPRIGMISCIASRSVLCVPMRDRPRAPDPEGARAQLVSSSCSRFLGTDPVLLSTCLSDNLSS